MIESRDGRRVVVTGLGVIAPCGIGVDAFWDGLAKPVEPAVIRPVNDFHPESWGLGRVEARRLDRFAQFGIAAAAQALADAGLLADVTADGALPTSTRNASVCLSAAGSAAPSPGSIRPSTAGTRVSARCRP